MSVLTVVGSNIPDPTLPYDYSRPHPPNPATLPVRTAHSTPPGAYTRTERRTYNPTTIPQSTSSPRLSSHQHSRTISSGTNAAAPFRQPSSSTSQPLPAHSRVTSSSHSRQSSASHNMNMQRQGTTASANSLPRRSTSGRSIATNSPTSYVALMRKQKATVWCDRAQSTDPRLAAAQKAAKQRAALEVQSVNNSGRTSTINSGGVVGKIRHGGVPKAPGYVPANLNGASVPLRLSANEMLGDDEEAQSLGDNSMRHARTGSGRSSTNSAKYRSGYPRPDQGRFSSTSTPPNGETSPSRGIPEHSEETPASKQEDRDDEDSFGELKDLSGPSSVQRAMEQAKVAEDLRRRGSVDERTMSMGAGVRLFVANPDIED
ncbi:uncharacterized protein PV06_05313 [Exophiala oligosperma]|uniref:Uncharacterized protein n=1 Tax=Exophiala oligosperma TaxID=215243 RepID=A0A0D2DMX5_9EURO|nr:uncharacterized protein PV06_05313 [Exophiala oligosperma]KIW44293.1 hypothetical protein PV06_05313 [Exophiala oligosperma]